MQKRPRINHQLKIRPNACLLCIFNLLLTIIACEEANKSSIDQTPVVWDVIHIIWTLESVSIEEQEVDLSTYEPFTLIYSDSKFFGSEGCNRFHGTFESKRDSIIPTRFGKTEMGCGNVKTYSACFLGWPHRIEITDDTLTIFINQDIYTFYSDLMTSIEDNPILGKEWTLVASNDPLFDIMNAPRFTSTLSLSITREFDFYIQWNNDEYQALFHNTSYGIFGVDNNNRIRLYRRGSSGRSGQAGDCARNILKSSSYSVVDSLFTLIGEGDTLRYEFIN